MKYVLKRKELKIFWQLLVMTVMITAVGGCTITNKYGPYYGKVVDAKTKEPIEGAAVLIVFHTVSATVGGAVYKYADAVETVTDRNGEFKILAQRFIAPGVLRRWDEYGSVTIFKPGYGCYPNHKEVLPIFENNSLPPNQYVTVEMPKLMTKEERLKNYGCYPSESVPEVKYQRLFRLIQQERVSLGLEARRFPKGYSE